MPDLLTVGGITYTGDTQVMAAFTYPDNWKLRMVDVQEKDSGLYVCQISTHPPIGLHAIVSVRCENAHWAHMYFTFSSLGKV